MPVFILFFLKHCPRILSIGTMVGFCSFLLLAFSAETQEPQAPAVTTPVATSVQVTTLLQEAEIYAQQEEFTAAYDLYLRVLGMEVGNTTAREAIFAILTTHKAQIADATDQEQPEQTTLLYQQYRNEVRDFLQLLTLQLKRTIQRYGELVALQKAGEDVKLQIVPILTSMIQILNDVKTVYQDFPQTDDTTGETQKVVERLNETIKKYKEELLSYQ